jgi:D-alanyl-D-alanine carboxypeptidase
LSTSAAEQLDMVVERTEEIANATVAADQAPGIVVRAGRGTRGQIVVSGLADAERRRPVHADDRFPIGSITKTMVAAVVMQLVDERRLRLQDTVERWQPGLLQDGDTITIEQLLSHGSGLVDYTEAEGFAFGRTYTPTQLVELAESRPRRFAPGAAHEYSNTNFIVLGMIVEKAAGRPLGEVLAVRVFGPLGMSATQLGPVPPSGAASAVGYDERGREVHLQQLSGAWAAGGVTSTAEDLHRFLAGLLLGRLTSPAAFAQMTRARWTDTNPAYGLGLAIWESPCGRVFGHHGLVPGYTAQAWAAAGLSRSAVALANTSAYTEPLTSVVNAALCT